VPIATDTRERPGRVRLWAHRVLGALGWVSLVLLAVWRHPESPPWRLPLPIGLLPLLTLAAVLVLVALVWARTADRRRRPRPGPAKAPPRRRPVPEPVAR
jgi:hypothetical protein